MLCGAANFESGQGRDKGSGVWRLVGFVFVFGLVDGGGSGGGRVRAGPRGGGCGGAEGFSAGDGLTGGWWSGGCGAASGRTSERTVLISLLDAGDAAELDRMSGCGRVLSFFVVK